MSQPFTRDEAKSAVWAQVEDFELPERIKMLFEVTVDMIRLVLNDAETDEALIDELTEAITAKGTFITDQLPLCAKIAERSSEPLTFWPSPVRSRWKSAAQTPIAAQPTLEENCLTYTLLGCHMNIARKYFSIQGVACITSYEVTAHGLQQGMQGPDFCPLTDRVG